MWVVQVCQNDVDTDIFTLYIAVHSSAVQKTLNLFAVSFPSVSTFIGAVLFDYSKQMCFIAKTICPCCLPWLQCFIKTELHLANDGVHISF